MQDSGFDILGQHRGSDILEELKFESIPASVKILAWILEARMISYLGRDGYGKMKQPSESGDHHRRHGLKLC